MIMTIYNKKILLVLFTLLLVLFILPPTYLYAAKAEEETSKVYDYFDLFDEGEERYLEDILASYSEEGKVDIIVITTDDLEAKSKQVYMEDFYDLHAPGYDEEYGDTVLLMLYMNPDDRSVEIQGYKEAEYYINNQVIEDILDGIFPYLADGEYVEALEKYAELVSAYMNAEVKPEKSPHPKEDYEYFPDSSYNEYTPPANEADKILTNPLFQLVAALILGGITVGIMASNSGGKITTNNRTYLNANNSSIVAHYDNYIRTTTTKTRKPQNTNNNSGGGGHTRSGTSSGGHSHSGGGRKF